jgi:hypothetical protein
MVGCGQAFSVIARQKGDEFPVAFGEFFPRTFPNETGGLFMVGSLLRGGRPADVMEERAGHEEFQFGRFESMEGFEFTKKKNRPESDVADVLGFLFDLSHPSGGFSDER